MKVRLAIAIGSVSLLALAGCTAADVSTDTTDAATGDAIVVGYSGAVQADPNNKAVEDAMRVKVEELGGRLIVTDAQLDAGKQFGDVQSLINQDIDVLVIWPMDPLSIQPVIQQAADAGIPVIVQDTSEGGPYASNFQVTNFEAAADAAALIEEAVGSNANVVQLEGIPSVGVLNSRNEGFRAGAEAAGQVILASQVNELNSADGARPIVDAWKSRFCAEIQAIFAYNDSSALGAASAKSADFDPVVIGMNGDQDAVAAVRDGRLLATFDMHPVEIGAGLGWAAMYVANGGTLPETVNAEMTVITAENIDDWTPVADLLTKSFDIEIVEKDGVSTLVATIKG
jgi:ribose transport system substrate-binding protein